MSDLPEEDDCIVEEIPIYFSRNMENNLYMLQYPTKAPGNTFDNAKVLSCSVKPQSHQLKVDFAIDTETRFFDKSKAQELATLVDGASRAKGERVAYNDGVMDKQTYLSVCSSDDTGKYAVGIYADKELHLSPLTGILQLHPSMWHFDKDDQRKKAEQKAIDNADKEDEVRQVTVKFSNKVATDSSAKKKGPQNLNDGCNQPWSPAHWRPCTTHTAELERQKLLSSSDQITHALGLESSKYLEKLVPQDGATSAIDTIVPSNVMAKARLRKMSLVDKLKHILIDTKMLTFDDILSFLQSNFDTAYPNDKVLRTLQQVGQLMHGNWFPKSELLYPPETFSSANGIKSELMIRARDYILFKFSRNTSLFRRELLSTIQLPFEEAHEVLRSVAVMNAEKKWQLLLPPDRKFELAFPELVQRQEMVWRATEQTYFEMDHEKCPKRMRKRSLRETKAQHPVTPMPPAASQPPVIVHSETETR